jgi:CHAT domain-containing protein
VGGLGTTDVLNVRETLASNTCEKGDYERGLPALADVVDDRWQRTQAAYDSANDGQLALLNRGFRTTFDKFLRHSLRAGADPDGLYRHVLATKGAAFAAEKQRRLVRDDPDSAQLVGELAAITRRIAGLASISPDPAKAAEVQRELYQLGDRRDAVQRELVNRSATYRKKLDTESLSAESLRRRLPKDVALVDFLQYHTQAESAAAASNAFPVPHLVAFVLRNDRPTALVRLGPLEPLEVALNQWRSEIVRWGGGAGRGLRRIERQEHTGAAASARQRVSDLVWKPLESHIEGKPVVAISPDGLLAHCPWNALPGRREGGYLLEDVSIAVVPFPRELPELIESGAGRDSNRYFLLVGDVNFDARSMGHTATEATTARSSLRNAAAIAGQKSFESLPGTAREIELIRELLARAGRDELVHLLRGDRATEQQFREAARGARALHLATHGFFARPLTDGSAATEPSQRAPTVSEQEISTAYLAWTMPGLASGLVLAGANVDRTAQGQESQDDGILTASEVAEIDLRGAELIVLSACETGLGMELTSGEGLLGLERAFAAAGARAVVSSLWQVDDDATQALMVEFYRNWHERGLGKLEALRKAQLTLLAGESFRPRGSAEPGRLPPGYWAAFQLSGDWREGSRRLVVHRVRAI